MEDKKKRIMERLKDKYNDKDRVPTAYERVIWLGNFLYPYFKTFKLLMTVITPSKCRHTHKTLFSPDFDMVRQEL
jgi:hypothetical protein